MTGPGRPGRDEQACLTAIAAVQVGWDYPRLLLEMLSTAVPLRDMGEIKPSSYQFFLESIVKTHILELIRNRRVCILCRNETPDMSSCGRR